MATPTRYTATAAIKLSSKYDRGGGDSDAVNNQKTQMTILQNPEFLRKVFESLDIRGLNESLDHGDLNDQIGWLKKDMVVGSERGNPEVVPHCPSRGNTRATWQTILNKVAKVYLEENKEREQKRLRDHADSLRNMVDKASERLKDRRSELRELEQHEGLENPKAIQDKIARLDGQLLPYQREREAAAWKMPCARSTEDIKAGSRLNFRSPETIPIDGEKLRNELKQDNSYKTLDDAFINGTAIMDAALRTGGGMRTQTEGSLDM